MVEATMSYCMIMLSLRRQGWTNGAILLVTILACQMIRGAVDSCAAEGFTTSHEGKSFTTYRVDLRHQHLELWSKDDAGARVRNAKVLKGIAEKQGKRLIFATNAGIFSMWFVPLGLHIERGQQTVPLNTDSGAGNFYMKPNGVFSIMGHRGSIVATEAFNASSPLEYATQSGPLLVQRGTITSSFNPHSENRLVRSGVGIRGESEVFFAIANEPVSFYEFASLFRDRLGCSSALYLDGVISAMYAADIGREQTSGDFAAMFALFEDIPHNQTTRSNQRPR